MVTPAWVRSRSTPIALPDLLGYLVAVANCRRPRGHILDAGGPDADLRGDHALLRRSWSAAGRASSGAGAHAAAVVYWLRFVTSVPTNVARALVEGLKHDFVAHDDELRALVPRRL